MCTVLYMVAGGGVYYFVAVALRHNVLHSLQHLTIDLSKSLDIQLVNLEM